MALTSRKRPLLRSRKPSTSTRPKPTHGSHEETFKTTKDDKRRIKHSALISRIEKSNHTTIMRRRRPSKKLITTLESLADALPEISNGGSHDNLLHQTRMRHQSLKSKPGAMKKKDQLERLEKERFSKNMAQMATANASEPHDESGTVDATTVGGSSKRWAALRSFIQQTMDRDPSE